VFGIFLGLEFVCVCVLFFCVYVFCVLCFVFGVCVLCCVGCVLCCVGCVLSMASISRGGPGGSGGLGNNKYVLRESGLVPDWGAQEPNALPHWVCV